MKPILIFRHVTCEGPGYLANVLDRFRIPYHIVCIDQDEELPESLDDTSGLVFMGGYMSVNDDLPWIHQELKLIRKAVNEGLPVLGHCLGGQLISKALGGSVEQNPAKEIGWHEVEKVNSPVAQEWLGSLPQQFEVFHWHGETFSIPPGATRILQSHLCTNQAFVINNTLALQCHVEMLPDMIVEWAQLYEHELNTNLSGVQSAEEMTNKLEQRTAGLQIIADALYSHWLRPLLT